jgi:Fe/S biogenesis protein NfuA
VKEETKEQVKKLFEDVINPAVADHGGFIELVDVKENKVYVRLTGGCQGCGAAMMTLKQGIEQMLKHQIPEIEEVVDETDHTAGSNPYYEPMR